jgi:hypothetical protein
MIRSVLIAMLVLLSSGVSFADNKAKIKALNEQIQQVRQKADAQEKTLDVESREAMGMIGKLEAHEKAARAQLEGEEKKRLTRIDEIYDHVIRNLDPKQVHLQMHEGLKTLRRVHEVISVGDFDYGGHRAAAQSAVAAAEKQLKLAEEHFKPEEMVKAGKDLEAAYRDIEKALAYSVQKYGLGNGPKGGEPETRATANRELFESLSVIENTHHLLRAVDHEIKDFEHEKRELLKRRDEKKKEAREAFHAMAEKLTREIHEKQHQMKQLAHEKQELKKQVHAEAAAEINKLEAMIKKLK